jgi:hypothetical protein
MKRGFLNNNASTSAAQQLEQDIDDIIEFTSPHILKVLSEKDAEKVDNKVYSYPSFFKLTRTLSTSLEIFPTLLSDAI